MYTLRDATSEDRDFLYRLRRATLKEYVDRIWGWDEAVQRRMFDERFDPARYQIVTVDGRDVGAVSVERRPDGVFLADLHILPAHQGRGLGAAVIGDILMQARGPGLPVTLQVLKGNPARRLYERLGFVVTGETPTHYQMRHDAGRGPVAQPGNPSRPCPGRECGERVDGCRNG